MSSETSPWRGLRRWTDARVGIGRVGNGIPTDAHLDFLEGHARARDAVHAPLDVPRLTDDLEAFGLLPIAVRSAAPDRRTYLLRPDLGRTLVAPDRERLRDVAAPGCVCWVVADGLSALAVQTHAPAMLARLVPGATASGLASGPLVVVEQGRVGIGDDIGAALGAQAVVVLVGERPGLSAVDSMGIYITWSPGPQRTDAERNCISNVRVGGSTYDRAADRTLWILRAARQLRATGVGLKDGSTGEVSLGDPERDPGPTRS